VTSEQNKLRVLIPSTGQPARQYLEAFLDGELSEALHLEVEKAIQSDPELVQELAALSELQSDFSSLRSLRSEQVESTYRKDFALDFMKKSVEGFGEGSPVDIQKLVSSEAQSSPGIGKDKATIPSGGGLFGWLMPKRALPALAIAGTALGLFAIFSPISGSFPGASSTASNSTGSDTGLIQVAANSSENQPAGSISSAASDSGTLSSNAISPLVGSQGLGSVEGRRASGQNALVAATRSSSSGVRIPSVSESVIQDSAIQVASAPRANAVNPVTAGLNSVSSLPPLLGRTGNESELLTSRDRAVLKEEFGGMTLDPNAANYPAGLSRGNIGSAMAFNAAAFGGSAAGFGQPLVDSALLGIARAGGFPDARNLTTAAAGSRGAKSGAIITEVPGAVRPSPRSNPIGIRRASNTSQAGVGGQTLRPFAIAWIESAERYSFVPDGNDETMPVIWVHRRGR